MTFAAPESVWFWVSVALWNLGAMVTFYALRVSSLARGTVPPPGGYLVIFIIWPIVPIAVLFAGMFGKRQP